MANFIDEPTRGDGTSWKLTKQNFNKPPHFHEPTIEELKTHLEEKGREESTRDSFLEKSTEVVRAPAKLELLLRRPGKGLFAQKYKNGAQLCWMSGFWCAQLQIKDRVGYELKFPAWSLAVLVGTTYRTDASTIRSEIIKVHTANGYQKWKRAVTEDRKGRTAVLDAIANYLGQKKKVAFSYVDSSSSKTLLNYMGIQVHLNYAMIYPHFKGNWTMKASPYQATKTNR